MFLTSFMFWFRGYIKVKIRGPHISKLVTYAAKEGIPLRNLVNVTTGYIVFEIFVSDHAKLSSLARNFYCTFEIIERYGLPFFFEKLRRRKGLVFGAILFFIILAYMTSLVWNINIAGLKSIDETSIMRSLSDMGIKKWTSVHKINLDDIDKKLANEYDKFAFVASKLDGTVLNIEVVEKVLPSVPKGRSDIIASKDGQITKLILLSGVPLVKEGDVVTKGQVLVEGTTSTLKGEFLQPRCVLEAKVWYTSDIDIPLEIEERVRTGRTSTRYVFNLFGLKFSIGLKPKYDAYDRSEYAKRAGNRRNNEPIVEVNKLTFYELMIDKRVLSLEEAKKLGCRLTYEEALLEVIDQNEIVNVTYTYKELYDDNQNIKGVRVKTIIEVSEDISSLVERDIDYESR